MSERKYTESQVKALGGKRFFQKRKKRILILLALAIGWIPLLDWLTVSIRMWVYFAPLAIVLINILWSWWQSRKLLWDRYKKDPTILE